MWDYFPFFLFVIVLVGIYLLYRRNDRQRRMHLASIPNFTGVHQLDTSSHIVAFDVRDRRVAFAHATGVRVFSFDDIVHFEWTWTVSNNGSKTNNYLNFQVNNISTPLFKVRCNTANQAEHWLAKIPAILAK